MKSVFFAILFQLWPPATMAAIWCHPPTAAEAVGQESPRDSACPRLGSRPRAPGPRLGAGVQAPQREALRGLSGAQGVAGHVPSAPGRTAQYLHDGLGKVPGAPVAEARLHRGRDEALVSGGIVRVIGGLPGAWGGDKGTEAVRQVSLPLRVRSTVPAHTEGRGGRCRPVSGWPRQPRCADRALGAGIREGARVCVWGAVSPPRAVPAPEPVGQAHGARLGPPRAGGCCAGRQHAGTRRRAGLRAVGPPWEKRPPAEPEATWDSHGSHLKRRAAYWTPRHLLQDPLVAGLSESELPAHGVPAGHRVVGQEGTLREKPLLPGRLSRGEPHGGTQCQVSLCLRVGRGWRPFLLPGCPAGRVTLRWSGWVC